LQETRKSLIRENPFNPFDPRSIPRRCSSPAACDLQRQTRKSLIRENPFNPFDPRFYSTPLFYPRRLQPATPNAEKSHPRESVQSV
jgi:hypothetical protein